METTTAPVETAAPVEAAPTTTAPVTTAPATTAPASHLGGFIDDKGAFKPGWTKVYGLPDSLEAKFTSPEALLKSHVSLERMLGNQNKVAIPGATATPEERNAFFKAIGRPDKPEDYGLKAPEKLGDKPFPKEKWNPESANHFSKFAHEIGLSKDQANRIAEYDLNRGMGADSSNKEAIAKARSDATAALKSEWGTDYDTNLAKAHKAALEVGGEELVNDPAFGDNPKFLRAMAKVGAMILEEPAAGARGTSHSAVDPKSAIAAIKGDKTHPYWIKGHPQHDAAVATMKKLYDQAHPEPAR